MTTYTPASAERVASDTDALNYELITAKTVQTTPRARVLSIITPIIGLGTVALFVIALAVI